jgi:phosphoglycerate-specific signal transduction histidine kinase
MTAPELFPMKPSEKLQALRKHLIAESEKAEEGVERAEAKVDQCHQRLYMINEAIEAMEKAEKAAAGIVSYDVNVGTGEVSS